MRPDEDRDPRTKRDEEQQGSQLGQVGPFQDRGLALVRVDFVGAVSSFGA